VDAATLASLQGTLTPEGVLSVLQAEQQRQEKELAQRTAQATQEAQQASTAFSGAAAAPVQEPDALAQFLPQLLGNVASVLGRTPAYREQGEATVAERRKNLKQQRMDNLSALKSIWDQKADAAQKAGDLESSLNARAKSEQLAKTLDVMLEAEHAKNAIGLEKERQKGAISLEQERGRQDRQTNLEKPTPGLGAGFDLNKSRMLKTTRSGKKFVDIGGVTGNAKTALIMAADAAGYPVPDKAAVAGLGDVDRARRDLDKLEKDVLTLVPHDAQGRIIGYAGRKIRQLSQSDPARGAFRVWADAAIPVLRATAGSRNLRITQEQVKLAISNLPTMDDTFETVEKKLAILRSLLDNAEGPLIDSDWRDPENVERYRKP